MKLEGVWFLAGDTARSQAYAQAMVRRRIEPEGVLFFSESNQRRVDRPTATVTKSSLQDLYLPDLQIPLLETCDRCGWPLQWIASDDVNDPRIAAEIRKVNPRLVIYSGYGGQIVQKATLALGPPFLHIHSGWLPEERGSTTLYYSLLRADSCSASAILLRETIDTGPILARKRYPKPLPGMDVDHCYDSAIRADLLIEMLSFYQKHGVLPEAVEQDSLIGTSHYVIHPVLKHLALLSVDCPA